MSAGTEVVIRPARTQDLPAVRALLSAAELPLDGLEDQYGEGYVVAEAGGSLVGAAGVEVHGSHGLLRSVVVAAGRRRGGLGERLVRDRLRWAEQRELRAVYLLTTTAPDFFARLGFAPAERSAAPAELQASREFASVCPASAAVMVHRPEVGA